MTIAALIMSGLALLAAGVCLYLLMQEKKRNKKRNAAVEMLADALGNETANRVQTCNKLVERVSKLEQGVVPDYAAAKAAANAVNDFNKGISNILGFDPVAALQAQRKNERQVDED